MLKGSDEVDGAPRGFLARLLRDRRGNAMTIMAMAFIPMAGMVGGGVDISRMYILKTRLQHACDAGALAGRKAMGGGTWSQNSGYPGQMANRFFDANFETGSFASTGLTRTFTESAGKVTGTASATIPMTLMRIFLRTTETITVTCDADMRLPNTDVMFVLDVTGSMNCVAGDITCTNNGEVPAVGSKIDGLKEAVKCFYEIVARLDSNANCTTGTPSGGTGNQVQIRFGFVPYASNVNVGRLLPTSYFPDSATYQSRRANFAVPAPTTNGPYWEVYGSSISSADCTKYQTNQAFTGFTPTATSSGGPNPQPTVATTFPYDGSLTSGTGSSEWSWSGASDTSGTSRSCRRLRTDTTTYYIPEFVNWTYGPTTINFAGLKNGTSWNTSFTASRLGANGTDVTVNWDGCIEERQTVQATSYSPIPAGAKDLDIDSAPVAGDATTMWKPSLPQVLYLRNIQSYWSEGTTATSTTTANYFQGAGYRCPTEARKLRTYATASDFDDYVDSLEARGNTYHDIGMIWGARLMSPTGIFASENATTPQGGDIERHMIFMTDGDATSNPCDYNAYGVPWWDRRQSTDVGAADFCPTNRQALIDQINVRLEALCTAVKNKNITLWVVSFGGGLNATTETRLSNCATPGRYFQATNNAALQQTFKNIADQISQLRLTR